MEKTFSERNGLGDGHEETNLGELSQKLRMDFWNKVYNEFEKSEEFDYFDLSEMILKDCFTNFFGKEAVKYSAKGSLSLIRNTILSGEVHNVFDLIEHLLEKFDQNSSLNDKQKTGFFPFLWYTKETFERFPSAYMLIHDGNRHIFTPQGHPEEDESLKQAFQNTEDFPGARNHLAEGILKLREGKYCDSIRESIHSLESLGKLVSGKKGATLPKALNEMKRDGFVPKLILDSLDKLYAYTSNEPGLRHAKINENSSVKYSEAHFMIVTCSAYLNYIIAKYEESKKQNSKTE